MTSRVKTLLGAGFGALMLLGVALPAFAAEPTAAATPPAVYCGSGFGAGGPWGGGLSVLDSVSKLLGMDAAQIAAERHDGKSLVDIAASKNVSEEALINAILADRKAILDARVKAGTLTQQQEDYMLQRMQENVKAAVERTTVGPMGPQGGLRQGIGFGGHGRGMAGAGWSSR